MVKQKTEKPWKHEEKKVIINKGITLMLKADLAKTMEGRGSVITYSKYSKEIKERDWKQRTLYSAKWSFKNHSIIIIPEK